MHAWVFDGLPMGSGSTPMGGNGYYIGTHGPLGMGNGQRPLPIGYPFRGLRALSSVEIMQLANSFASAHLIIGTQKSRAALSPSLEATSSITTRISLMVR